VNRSIRLACVAVLLVGCSRSSDPEWRPLPLGAGQLSLPEDTLPVIEFTHASGLNTNFGEHVAVLSSGDVMRRDLQNAASPTLVRRLSRAQLQHTLETLNRLGLFAIDEQRVVQKLRGRGMVVVDADILTVHLRLRGVQHKVAVAGLKELSEAYKDIRELQALRRCVECLADEIPGL
jgi:hypothetical protein